MFPIICCIKSEPLGLTWLSLWAGPYLWLSHEHCALQIQSNDLRLLEHTIFFFCLCSWHVLALHPECSSLLIYLANSYSSQTQFRCLRFLDFMTPEIRHIFFFFLFSCVVVLWGMVSSFAYLSLSPILSTTGTALYSAPYFSIPSTMHDISEIKKKNEWMVFDVPSYLLSLIFH